MKSVICWKCNKCSKDFEISRPCMLSVLAEDQEESLAPQKCPFNESNIPEWIHVTGKFI